jgi:HEAT repeat protein
MSGALALLALVLAGPHAGGPRRESTQALLATIGSGDRAALDQALARVGHVHGQDAEPAFVALGQLLPSPDVPVRIDALYALGVLASPSLPSPVADAVAGRLADRDPAVRLMAARALRRHAESFRQPAVRGRRMAPAQVARLVPPLRASLADSNAAVPLEAAAALGAMGGPAAGAALRARLKAASPPVRAACASALGTSGDRAAGPALRPLAGDGAPEVRRAATRALLLVGDPQAQRAVTALSRSDQPDDRVDAAAIAALRETSWSTALLSGLLADGDWRVRVPAASALAARRRREGVVHLVNRAPQAGPEEQVAIEAELMKLKVSDDERRAITSGERK